MMILESGANNVILTLNELKTLDAPEYVIVFKSYATGLQTGCKLGADLSEYPQRFNKFAITVKTSPNNLNAEVALSNYGQYKYFVYEKADADTFDFAGLDDLDPEEIAGEVERGFMEYISEETALEYYKNLRESIKSYQ